MATAYRETTLLKVELYTIRDDDHKPILYLEADNKGEPLEVSLTNPGDKPITFKSFTVPTADNFHVQLRFRRNVIAPHVLRALQSPTGGVIEGWQYAAGTAADGSEDYISFVKPGETFVLDKGESERIQIPNFSAAAQGGARNTRIQVRYRTEPQDPGSVIRHMEVQSHLGLKNIPLIARFCGSNTILNDGKTSNELTLEVVCLNNTGSVRLDDASKFELIIDDAQLTSGSSLAAVSRSDWLQAQPVKSGIGFMTLTFLVKRPKDSVPGMAQASLTEITRNNPLRFDLSNWVTDLSPGTYNILLRYENIPGYWDGAWVLPVQFSPLVLRGDKIGIGTDEPEATLHVKGDTRIEGNLNVGGSANGAINVRHINGKSDQSTEPDVLQLNYDNGKNVEVGSAQTAANLIVHGRVTDRTGEVMPAGAIVAFGGSTAPPGWLMCNGQTFDGEKFFELYQALGNRNAVPDLQDRFILGRGTSTPEIGGNRSITLSEEQIPAHTHAVKDPGHSHLANKYFRESSTDVNDDSLPVYAREGEAKDQITDLVQANLTNITLEKTGGGQSIDIMPPYYVLTYIIKA